MADYSTLESETLHGKTPRRETVTLKFYKVSVVGNGEETYFAEKSSAIRYAHKWAEKTNMNVIVTKRVEKTTIVWQSQ